MSSNDLTQKERKILRKFRKCVSDIITPSDTDNYLLRWLRARNFNLKDAEEMLRKHVEWRKSHNMEAILQSHKSPEVLNKYWPMGVLGYSKEGCPVWLVRYGEADIKGIIYSLRRTEIFEEFAYNVELNLNIFEQQTKKLGKVVDRNVTIVDLNKFSLNKFTWAPLFDILKSLINAYEDNCPETLKAIYLINAPTVVQFALALLKPFISEITFNKIRVFGKDGWQAKLIEEIDASVLPVNMGGTRVGLDNDLDGFDLVPKGGKVPTSYYIETKLYDQKNVKTLEIPSQSCCEVDINVEKPESVLNWEYQLKESHIGVGLFFRQDGKLEELSPVRRLDNPVVPENGTWLCHNAGNYVLKFDNTESWFKSKTINYWTEVIPPN